MDRKLENICGGRDWSKNMDSWGEWTRVDYIKVENSYILKTMDTRLFGFRVMIYRDINLSIYRYSDYRL